MTHSSILYYALNVLSYYIGTARVWQITFSRRLNPVRYSYKMNGTPLHIFNKIKDLGIILSFYIHIETIRRTKVTRNLSFIKRSCDTIWTLNV